MTEGMKTLTCPGPPQHTFEIPIGRGRPPKFCPEHRPDKPAGKSESPKKPAKVKKELPSPAEVPVNRHPESERHQTNRVAHEAAVAAADVADNPFVKRAKERAAAEKAARLQGGKEKAAEERSEAAMKLLRDEYALIDGRIERAETEYTASMAECRKAKTTDEITAAFNKSDQKQRAILNLSARKLKIERALKLGGQVESTVVPVIEHRANPILGTGEWVNTTTGERLGGEDIETIDPTRSDFADRLSEIEDREIMREQLESEGDEPTEGYNDLLSNPAQFDGPYEDFGDIISAELGS